MKLTPEHMNYPRWVCRDCALQANGRTTDIVSVHNDICGVCADLKTVSSPRDWGYPTFEVKGN